VSRQIFLTALGKGTQIALMAAGAIYVISWLIGPRLDPDFNWIFFSIMFLAGFLGHLSRASHKS